MAMFESLSGIVKLNGLDVKGDPGIIVLNVVKETKPGSNVTVIFTVVPDSIDTEPAIPPTETTSPFTVIEPVPKA
jgi:hypothetical protein